MKKVITYGTYDLLHYGHIRLLERAKELGDYLIVGITSDDFDRSRGKINVKQPLMERVQAVRDTGIADQIIIEEYPGQKIDDILKYDVDIFTVGSDWVGKFDYLKEYCDVVYLDRTEGVSSSALRANKSHLRLGLVGESLFLEKVLRESRYVNGIEIAGFYTHSQVIEEKMFDLGIASFPSYDALLDSVEAVYIISHPAKHVKQIRQALESGKHVLCEAPIALSVAEYHELKDLAASKGCVLVDSLKTAYSMAYERLQLMVKSGHIGKIVSVDAVCTSLRLPEKLASIDPDTTWNSICIWGPVAMLPVFQILGIDYQHKHICSHLVNEKLMLDSFTKVDFVYEDAVASVKVGSGAKSESELIITGTRGYLYVPAPWWKTDYFEIRYENPADNKRYFYQLEGEGIRYELVSFCRAIEGDRTYAGVPEEVTEASIGVIESFYARRDFTKLAGTGHGQDTASESVF